MARSKKQKQAEIESPSKESAAADAPPADAPPPDTLADLPSMEQAEADELASHDPEPAELPELPPAPAPTDDAPIGGDYAAMSREQAEAAASREIAALNSEKHDLKAAAEELKVAIAAIDERISEVRAELERSHPPMSAAESYRQWAKSQARQRLERAQRTAQAARMFDAGSIGRSPLDQALRSRGARGPARPEYPLLGGPPKKEG